MFPPLSTDQGLIEIEKFNVYGSTSLSLIIISARERRALCVCVFRNGVLNSVTSHPRGPGLAPRVET